MIRIVKRKRGGWEVDIRGRDASGRKIRDRIKSPLSSYPATLRWAQQRELAALSRSIELEASIQATEQKRVPTLAEFAPRFLDGYARANRQKPSEIESKDSIIRLHLVPAMGTKPLDEINEEEGQRLKARLAHLSVKRINNILTVLLTLLRVAHEWGELDRVPRIRLLPAAVGRKAGFHDFEEYARLVEAARRTDPRAYLIVLLGGDAGLRCGEMMALEWSDVDLRRRQLWVRRSEWQKKAKDPVHLTLPKGGEEGCVTMTSRLTEALRSARHLKGARVLCHADGSALNQDKVRNLVEAALRLAQLPIERPVHKLRHTFCSHLAMRGAPARAIQALARHQSLHTTERYMHLSPQAIELAIRLLETGDRGFLGDSERSEGQEGDAR